MLLDKVYVVAYVLIMAAILETIITAGWANSEKPEDIERVIRVERYFLIGNLIVLVVAFVLLHLTF